MILVLLGVVYLITGQTEPVGTPHSGANPVTSPAAAGSPTAPELRDAETGLAWIELDQLPSEAHRALERIETGGPYPYAKDGTVFGNREQILPIRRSGYYREFTVKTPAADDRGARRIVTGDRNREFFYTDDHYASFSRIRR